ncbi:MAG: type II restriction endonuclease [Akkermansia sp.]|nr:type II restriction endonuclease [Akkermansia sp.]
MNVECGTLASYFTGIVYKRLSAVECNPRKSNQHEFNATVAFLEVFGKPDEAARITTSFVYISDEEVLRQDGVLTVYDARKEHPTRTEYRAYFQSNLVTDMMREGDCVIFAKRPDQTALILVAQNNSEVLGDLLWLFGLSTAGTAFSSDTDMEKRRIPRSVSCLLDLIGIKLPQSENELEDMLEKFNGDFPKTQEFSEYARQRSNYIHALDGASPDDVILDWYSMEEHLYSVLERHIINQQIKDGVINADSFAEYAKRVLNRRKSRAGQALENHLEQMFKDYGIKYSRTPITEGRSKPDFIFPSIADYRTPSFPETSLHMLGVKTTCKDRWRQVLVEAERIRHKHLFTLERSISEAQTDEMKAHNLTLVVPTELCATYTSQQQAWLLNVEGFLKELRKCQ